LVTISAVCLANTASGDICNREAHYVCSGGHTLCPNHAIRLGGLRRKTDRKCRICADTKVRSTIRSIVPARIQTERRKELGEEAVPQDSGVA
jgi:hypothetical protein